MPLTLTYTSIDQFVPTTVHSDTAHNLPHNELIANDIQIAAYINTLQTEVDDLESVISSILFTQVAAFTASLSLTSTGTWVVLCNASLHSNIVTSYTLSMDGTVVQTSFGLGDTSGTDYIPFFGMATKVVASAPYSYTCTLSTGGSVYAGSGRVGIMAFKTAA